MIRKLQEQSCENSIRQEAEAVFDHMNAASFLSMYGILYNYVEKIENKYRKRK